MRWDRERDVSKQAIHNKERTYIMKKFFKRIGGAIVSVWDGIRFAVILWKEGKDG